MARRKPLPPIAPNACAVIEYTGDGKPVGRCWHTVKDGHCPFHGDVSAVQARYAETGQLTPETKAQQSKLRRQVRR